jgi:hypothetical protein
LNPQQQECRLHEEEKTWKDENYISKISEKLQAKNRKSLDQDKPP